MDLRDAYRMLELPVGATEQAVRDARKLLAKVWHPDRHANDPELQKKAEQKLADVNTAFEAIRAAKFPSSIPEPKPKPAPRAAPTPKPEQPAPAKPAPKSDLDFMPPRRVRWSVILLLVGAIGVGTYFAVVKLGSPSESRPDVPTPAPTRVTAEAAVAVEPTQPADAAAVSDVGGTFSLGATRDEVRTVQGEPTRIFTVITEDWSYGFSSVSFDKGTGRVVGWRQSDRELKVMLVPRDAAVAAKAKAAGGFTKGSTKDEVLAVQGTPATIDSTMGDTWTYGRATRIEFDEAGKVALWNEFDVKLKLR